MANGGRHRGRIALVLALLIHALAFQGARGIWDPDEGRYTAAALEMIRLDNYRDVFLHHEIPHFTKPPLTYWLLAGSFRAFGTREWAARLPGALAFWGRRSCCSRSASGSCRAPRGRPPRSTPRRSCPRRPPTS